VIKESLVSLLLCPIFCKLNTLAARCCGRIGGWIWKRSKLELLVSDILHSVKFSWRSQRSTRKTANAHFRTLLTLTDGLLPCLMVGVCLVLAPAVKLSLSSRQHARDALKRQALSITN